MPILISSNSRRGGGGGFKLFLVFAVAFAFGIFVGMRLDGIKGIEIIGEETKFADTSADTRKPQVSPMPLRKSRTNLTNETLNNGLQSEVEQDIWTSARGPLNSASGENYTNNPEATRKPSPPPEPYFPIGKDDKDAGNDINAENNDKYTLQVAAFKEIERAQIFVNELKEKGYYPYINPVNNSKGESWKLIRLGKFKTMEEARDFADLFEEKENISVLVKELGQPLKTKRPEPINPILP